VSLDLEKSKLSNPRSKKVIYIQKLLYYLIDFYLVVLELFNLIFLIFPSKIGVATRLE
jgi:hypothetical protein